MLRKETLHLQILQPQVSDLGFWVSGPEGFGFQDQAVETLGFMV